MESSKKEEQPLKLGRVKVHGRQARVTDSLAEAERRLLLTYAGNRCVFSERASSRAQGGIAYIYPISHISGVLFLRAKALGRWLWDSGMFYGVSGGYGFLSGRFLTLVIVETGMCQPASQPARMDG